MSLLAAHPEARIDLDPFPHVVIHNAFEPALYEQLSRDYPRLDSFAGGLRLADSTKVYRTATDLMNDPAVSECWRHTIDQHSGIEHYRLTYALFRVVLLDTYPDLEERFGHLESMRIGYEITDDFSDHDLLLNALLTIHAPNRGAPATDRRAHIKVPDKPILGHLMFPDPGDDTPGGGVELFDWPRSKVPLVGHHNVLIDAESLRPAKVTPTRRTRWCCS